MNWNVQAVPIMKMQGAKMRGEPTTIGIADLKLTCYATRMTVIEWQTDPFFWTTSCEVVRCNKFWNKKIHGWFRSHFLLSTPTEADKIGHFGWYRYISKNPNIGLIYRSISIIHSLASGCFRGFSVKKMPKRTWLSAGISLVRYAVQTW